MFQNDISFITKDIYREDILNLPEIIKELMEDHLKNSIATPFCFLWELEYLQDQLPIDWKLTIDERTNIPKNKIRLTISNAYFNVSRHFNNSLKNVQLRGLSIGSVDLKGNGNNEDIIAIDCDVYDQEKGKHLFELDFARGESPIKLSVTGGENFNNNCATFGIPSGYGKEEIELQQLNNIEPIIQFVKDLSQLDAK